MTQKSFPWDIPTFGDGALGFSDDEHSLMVLLLYVYDRKLCHITNSKKNPYSSSLVVSISGGDFELSAGAALVDGRIYFNDTAITLTPVSGNGYYRVILRKTEATQVVRAFLIFDAGSNPALTQSATVWEVSVASCQVVGGVLQIDANDTYPLDATSMQAFFRTGDNPYSWPVDSVGADKFWPIKSQVFQTGSVSHTPLGAAADISVIYPIEFPHPYSPIPFVTLVNLAGGTPANAIVPYLKSMTEAGFTLHLDDDTNVNGFYWIATGEDS
jgi:hypothetical protein